MTMFRIFHWIPLVLQHGRLFFYLAILRRGNATPSNPA